MYTCTLSKKYNRNPSRVLKRVEKEQKLQNFKQRVLCCLSRTLKRYKILNCPLFVFHTSFRPYRIFLLLKFCL